jgi:magnesium chelatase family protein
LVIRQIAVPAFAPGPEDDVTPEPSLCTVPQIEKYMGKISGPLMDRIDIHIEVPSVPFEELSTATSSGTNSEQMREDVMAARRAQRERFAEGPIQHNAQMTSRQVREFCALDRPCQQMLRHSVEEMGLSARAHDKILRDSRTIADVAGGVADLRANRL